MKKQREFFSLGPVIKVGPGDAVREGSVRKDGSRAAYAAPEETCPDCNGRTVTKGPDGDFFVCECCDGTGTLAGRWPVHVAPGDIVLYERHPWAVIQIEDRQFIVLHEEQHIIAVVEGLREELMALPYDPKLTDLVA